MRRPKTPKQIFEQWERLSNELLLKSWDGKSYANERYNARYDRIDKATDIYIDNIYKLCEVKNHRTDIRTNRCNYIWFNKAFYAPAYTKSRNPRPKPKDWPTETERLAERLAERLSRTTRPNDSAERTRGKDARL